MSAITPALLPPPLDLWLPSLLSCLCPPLSFILLVSVSSQTPFSLCLACASASVSSVATKVCSLLPEPNLQPGLITQTSTLFTSCLFFLVALWTLSLVPGYPSESLISVSNPVNCSRILGNFPVLISAQQVLQTFEKRYGNFPIECYQFWRLLV